MSNIARSARPAAILLSLAALAIAAQAPPGPDAGTPADGKAFRLLDRISKDVSGSIAFRGDITRAIAVSRAESGALTLCINCTEEKAEKPRQEPPQEARKEGAGAPAAETPPPGKEAPPPSAPKESVERTPPLGEILVCDVSRMWKTRFYDESLVYPNDSGFDTDYRIYEVFPVAGPDTATYLVGNLLLVTGRVPEDSGPKTPSADDFQLAMRRMGTTYLAPLGTGDKPPSRVRDTDPAGRDAKSLARSHHQEEPDWQERYRTNFVYRADAPKSPLTDAIVLFASSQEEFFSILDLRRLESKQSSYFWAPYRKHQIVHLDQCTLTVEGEGGGEEGSDPITTYVEYPYLVIVGPYAKIRMSGTGGGPETVLEIGYCDRCP